MCCTVSNVAFHVFGFPIYWYSLAYIFGIIFAVTITKKIAHDSHSDIKEYQIENYLNYAIIGILIGGRLGHVFFYDYEYFSEFPLEILKIWKGGMSFYGGFFGIIMSAYIYCRKEKIDYITFLDLWAISAPIGLFFGRCANFVNAELLGTPSSVAWFVVFKDGISRHPSQIYEAILEGGILFGVMLFCYKKRAYEIRGKLSAIFCIGYGISRFICEFFREADSVLSMELLKTTGMNFNQYISILMFIFGCLIYKKMPAYNKRF